MDAFASRADHVVLVNRIKAHTDFVGEVGSGLLKMLAIGLGKPKGAAICHRASFSRGHTPAILSFTKVLLRSEKILFGVGVIENAYGETARIKALPSGALVAEETVLLKAAKQLAARLPFDSVDVLVIDEMGKEISGTGFDTNIVGRIQQPLLSNDPASPTVKRIVVRDLTEESYGNALGVGIADFITQRLADKIDRRALYTNALAAQQPERARIPLALPCDREAINAAIQSVGMIPTEEIKFVRIKNTMQIGEVDLSEAYRRQVRARADLSVISDSRTLQFDADGNLSPF